MQIICIIFSTIIIICSTYLYINGLNLICVVILILCIFFSLIIYYNKNKEQKNGIILFNKIIKQNVKYNNFNNKSKRFLSSKFNLYLSGDDLKNRYIEYRNSHSNYIGLIDNFYVPYDQDFINNNILSKFSSINDVVYRIYKSDVYNDCKLIEDKLANIDYEYLNSYDKKLNEKIRLQTKLKSIKNKIKNIDHYLESKNWPSGKDIYGGSIILLNNNNEMFGFQYNINEKVYFKININKSIHEICGAYLGDYRDDPISWDDDGSRPIYGSGTKCSIINSIELNYFNNYTEMVSYIIYNNINYSKIKFSSKYEREKFFEIINSLPEDQYKRYEVK